MEPENIQTGGEERRKSEMAPSNDKTPDEENAGAQREELHDDVDENGEEEENESQKSFEELRPKVLDLCQSLWPEKSLEDFEVEDLASGSSHDVIGLAIKPSKWIPLRSTITTNPRSFFSNACSFLLQALRYVRTYGRSEPASEYVLRIPRSYEDGDFNFDFDSAILKFVDGITDFDVPRIVQFDKTIDNPLGRPYVLQHRLPGRCLDDLWEELNHAQRLCIAKECARFLSQLTQLKNIVGGKVDPKSVPQDGYPKTTITRDVSLHQFEKSPGGLPPTNVGQPAGNISPLKLIQSRLIDWKEGPDEMCPYDCLAKMAGKLEENSNVFGPEQYFLSHGDFFARNIMAKVVNESTATITGILDWDLCGFKPAVVAKQDPSWLWSWDRDDFFALHTADLHKPITEEEKEIKNVFEAGVDKEFKRINTIPEREVARWLWTWAVDGIFHSTDWKCAFEALKEYGDPEGEWKETYELLYEKKDGSEDEEDSEEYRGQEETDHGPDDE